MRWIIPLVLIGGVAAADTHGLNMRNDPPPASPKAPAEPQVQPPKKMTATLIVRGQGGAELKRLNASSADGAKAICAYAPGKPMPDTLAFAVGVPDQWQMQGQVKSAEKSPAVDGLQIGVEDAKKSSIVTFTGGPDVCSLSRAKFDGQNADLSFACHQAAAQLGAQLDLQLDVHVEGCQTIGGAQ